MPRHSTDRAKKPRRSHRRRSTPTTRPVGENLDLDDL
jgi:hypothetical protein